MRKDKNQIKFKKLGSYTANMRRKNANRLFSSLTENLDPIAMKYAEECVNHIWTNIGSGEINLDYAVAGHDMRTGEAIYDYDLLSALLLSYGYSAGVTALFIEEFMQIGFKGGNRNIVITSVKKGNIFRDIRPLPDNPCAGNMPESK